MFRPFLGGSLKRVIGAVERLGFRVSVKGSGFRVSGLFRGSGLGFGV